MKYQRSTYQKVKIDNNKLELLKRLNREGNSTSSISRLLFISKSSVQRKLETLSQKVRQPVYGEENKKYEIDELKTYTGRKDNECWIMYAINRSPIDGIDLEGLEWVGTNPGYYLLEGFRQYFDAAVNSVTGFIEGKAGAETVESTTKKGNTTVTSGTVVTAKATVAYKGWDLYKPGAASKKPKVTVSTTVTVAKQVKATTTAGPATVTNTSLVLEMHMILGRGFMIQD